MNFLENPLLSSAKNRSAYGNGHFWFCGRGQALSGTRPVNSAVFGHGLGNGPFGQGLYLTDDISQAAQLAMYSREGKPVVDVYYLDIDSINVLLLETYKVPLNVIDDFAYTFLGYDDYEQLFNYYERKYPQVAHWRIDKGDPDLPFESLMDSTPDLRHDFAKFMEDSGYDGVYIDSELQKAVKLCLYNMEYADLTKTVRLSGNPSTWADQVKSSLYD